MATINPYRYAGYEYIEEIGIYDLNARYYNPEIARFLSPDPYYNLGNRVIGLYEINVPNAWSIIQANNIYVYCGNNPVRYIDFSGFNGAVAFFEASWSVAGGVAMLDSPIPGGADAVALFIGLGGSAIAGGMALWDLFTAPKSTNTTSSESTKHSSTTTVPVVGDTGVVSKPNTADNVRTAESDSTKDAVITDVATEASTKNDNQTIKIYRYGGSLPQNYVPNDLDVDSGTGLSFSTIPKMCSVQGETTLEALNATGVVVAVKDGKNHVSVKPIGGSLSEWQQAGETSIWTQAIWNTIIVYE